MLTRHVHDGATGPILTGLDAPVSSRGHGTRHPRAVARGYVQRNRHWVAFHSPGREPGVCISTFSRGGFRQAEFASRRLRRQQAPFGALAAMNSRSESVTPHPNFPGDSSLFAAAVAAPVGHSSCHSHPPNLNALGTGGPMHGVKGMAPAAVAAALLVIAACEQPNAVNPQKSVAVARTPDSWVGCDAGEKFTGGGRVDPPGIAKVTFGFSIHAPDCGAGGIKGQLPVVSHETQTLNHSLTMEHFASFPSDQGGKCGEWDGTLRQ